MVELSNFDNRPYRIPNQEEFKDLTDFIEAAEIAILKKLFGITLYEAYVAGIAAPTPDQKWVDLRDGTTYTYNEVEYEYRGLIELLVPCIYSMWLQENRDTVTSAGVVMKSSDRADRLSPGWRITRAFNDYSRQVGDFWHQEGTLYGFMKVNEDNYPDWVFEPPGTMNEFGL